MKTYLECIPCFFNQALEAGILAGVQKKKQKEIMDEVSKLIPELSLNESPPEMISKIQRVIRDILNLNDPYKKIKQKSNILALKINAMLEMEIKSSQDSLLTAIQISIIGNIIDYGAKNNFNVEEEIQQLLEGDLSDKLTYNPEVFKYQQFKDSLCRVKNILFLADNAGEVVFDRS